MAACSCFHPLVLGGLLAVGGGFVLAGLLSGSMWPHGAFVLWVGPQQLLTQWVAGCLIVGGLLLIGGARAPGAALVGSSVGSIVAYFTRRLYGGDHLETLVHGAVILASIGLVAFGLAGLRGPGHGPLGRYPMALILALGTVVVGALLIVRIHAEAAPTCSLITARRITNPSSPFAASCFRGFEDPWLQALLAFNVAFLALLYLMQARQAMRPFEEVAGRSLDRVISVIDPEKNRTHHGRSWLPDR